MLAVPLVVRSVVVADSVLWYFWVRKAGLFLATGGQ